MKKTLILMAAASAFVLTGCTETDLSSDTSLAKESAPDAIQFSASTRNAGVTRATDELNYSSGTIANEANTTMGTTALKNAGFGVFAYYTGANDYVIATNNSAPDFMYNQKLEWSTSDPASMWIYSPVKYWPNGTDAANVANTPSNTAKEKNAGKLSFFAFAPYMEQGTTATGGTTPTDVTAKDVKTPKKIDHDGDGGVGTPEVNNGIVAISDNTSPTNVWVKYEMPVAEANKAVDLLWGLRGSASYAQTSGNASQGTVGTDYNINLTKQTVGERVSFLFKHALAKVGGATTTETESISGDPNQCGFKVVADVDKNDGDAQNTFFPSNFKPTETLITIKEVKIQDGYSAGKDDDVTTVESTTKSNFNTFGWFNIETGSWCNETGTYGKSGENGATYNIKANSTDTDVNNETYTLNEKIREAASYGKSTETEKEKKLKDENGKEWSDVNPTGVTTTPQPLFAKENVPGLLVIPGGDGNELYITVDYVVRTADPNLNKGYTEVEQIITNKVSLGSLAPNKYYTIIMHLGLTSVKFEAVVTDWTLTSDATFDENGKVTEGTTQNEQKVWLPSNVIYAQTTTSCDIAKDETKTVFTAGETETYTINVSGLTSGHTVSVARSGVATAATADPTEIAAAGTTTVTVTLPANASNENKLSTITITEKDGSDNVVSTTTVNIIQNPKAE